MRASTASWALLEGALPESYPVPGGAMCLPAAGPKNGVADFGQLRLMLFNPWAQAS